MLGSAVSSRTPRDFQPNPHKGLAADPRDQPVTRRQLRLGMRMIAVGMHRALHSAMGLPNRSTSESWMLALVMPPEVRRNLMATHYVARLGVEIPETLAPGIEIELH